jgi:hypothetical protein
MEPLLRALFFRRKAVLLYLRPVKNLELPQANSRRSTRLEAEAGRRGECLPEPRNGRASQPCGPHHKRTGRGQIAAAWDSRLY